MWFYLKGFLPVWLSGNYNACYSTTSNFTDAVSPAFIIPGMYLICNYYVCFIVLKWHVNNLFRL